MALGIEQRTAPGRGATQEHINSWSLWRMEVPACDSILTLHRDAVNWPYAQSKSSDRNHIALLQAAVTQPSAPAWHTKSRSAWSSIIFQSLHDLKFSSMLLVKLFSQNHFSVPYREILGTCIILHDASVLALWPVPEGAAPVLSRSFEYQQKRSSSWGLKEGIDHLWWIGTCVVQEEWSVNGWKMWELLLSSKSLLLSPLWHKGPPAPVVWKMQRRGGERENGYGRQWMLVAPSPGIQSECSCLLSLSNLTIPEHWVGSNAPAINGP